MLAWRAGIAAYPDVLILDKNPAAIAAPANWSNRFVIDFLP
jgi:hypothetical protein